MYNIVLCIYSHIYPHMAIYSHIYPYILYVNMPRENWQLWLHLGEGALALLAIWALLPEHVALWRAHTSSTVRHRGLHRQGWPPNSNLANLVIYGGFH